ncbi:MAG: phosphate ABC transporter substrate-binding protein PstS [Thermoleophilia bacterium]|nr:phosphate ABC transporter substrate-binding protein PstS [Thermoleophilia bacterium]
MNKEEEVHKRSKPAYLAGLALVALLGALALAGCGGDDTSTSETTAPPTTTAAETVTTSGKTTTTAAALQASLSSAGATFPEPLYLEWIGAFQSDVQPDVSINYQGIGSGGGIQQFTQLTVDFGASDAPMKDEEIAAAEAAAGAKVLHIPTVFGAVTLAYNLEGVTDLQLDQDTLAGIFLGDITMWNDPMIAALNSGATLPDEAIQVVHRSDSSGTTSIFTGYMTQISPTWETEVGPGKEVQWPVGIGGQGNDGVAAVIQQQGGSIGYVELSYALESRLPVATLKNKAGNFVKPSLESTSAAAVGVTFPADLRFSLSDSEASGAYPIVGATWILAYDRMQDPAKAEALKAFLTWALTDGDSIAQELNYAPLPEELQSLALEKVDAISVK